MGGGGDSAGLVTVCGTRVVELASTITLVADRAEEQSWNCRLELMAEYVEAVDSGSRDSNGCSSTECR